eukprot:3937256-Rhodomonas_salina.3
MEDDPRRNQTHSCYALYCKGGGWDLIALWRGADFEGHVRVFFAVSYALGIACAVSVYRTSHSMSCVSTGHRIACATSVYRALRSARASLYRVSTRQRKARRAIPARA